jgi:hypothetical protein
LNGKPTKDNKFGKDVEFAMDLVSNSTRVSGGSYTDSLGPNHVSHRIRSHQWTKHEDGCTIPCRERCKDQRAYNPVKQVVFLTQDTPDFGTTHGQPVSVGHNREPDSDATCHLGRREPPIPLGIIPPWRSSFSSTHEET